MIVPRRSMLVALIAAMAIGLTALPASTIRAEEKGPVVFAAASMKEALDAVNAEWKKASGKSATISYAASSTLAKQIEQGAPADVFISADEDWMNYLAERKLIQPNTRFDLLSNSLVLIAPKDSDAAIKIAAGFPLAAALGDGRLAMADTASVPAGKYGKAALTKLGVWDSVKDKIAQAENVRAALALVSRGEVPLGIVYRTDARSDPKVKLVDIFTAGTHPPIIYPAAATAASKNASALSLLDYLKSSAAAVIFEGFGFKVYAPAG